MTMIKTTLAEQAYRELRSRIVSGRLAGGTRLLPNELAQDLGISPTPVKEACTRLEADGLVVVSARRGMVVRQLTTDDVEELYDARILLERGALELAFAKGAVTPELLAEMGASLDQHRRFAGGKSLDDLAKALSFDRKFHRLLVEASGIGMVTEWHEKAVAQTHTVFQTVQGNYELSVDEHQQVLDALTAGNLEKARLALVGHLERSRRNTVQQVQTLKTVRNDAG